MFGIFNFNFKCLMLKLSIKTHLRPIYEFYQDLRHYHTEGTVNVYPTMFLLIFMFVPFEILNLNVSKLFKKYLRYLLKVQRIVINMRLCNRFHNN